MKPGRRLTAPAGLAWFWVAEVLDFSRASGLGYLLLLGLALRDTCNPASGGFMDKEEMARRHRALVDLKEFLSNVQKGAARREAAVDRQLEAYDILLGLDSHPSADSRAAAEVAALLEMLDDETGPEKMLQRLAEDAMGEDVVWGISQRPSDAWEDEVPASQWESDRVSAEEFAQFQDCQSLIEIADRVAQLHDGVVSITKVTDIAEVAGFANQTNKRPRKQLWLRSYEILRKSDHYDYGGRGTGLFTRREDQTESSPHGPDS